MEDKTKILLCEDDENLGTLLCEYLIAKGYDAVLCPDGEVGFREFQKDKYDICILDVMMPKKDGFTLAGEIRQVNSQVPIIFLTARVQKEDVLEGFDKGADDYITKQARSINWRDSVSVQTTTSPSLSQWKNWLSALRPSSAA